MTRQCQFCGNQYDIDEETCPFCMAENNYSETYSANKTESTQRKVIIKRNINGCETTETRFLDKNEFDFSNKTVEEIKSEINKILEKDTYDSYQKNSVVKSNKKNTTAAIIVILICVLLAAFLVPTFLVINISPTSNQGRYEEMFSDESESYDDAIVADDLYGTDDEWQNEVNMLSELMVENPETYFLTKDGDLSRMLENTPTSSAIAVSGG